MRAFAKTLLAIERDDIERRMSGFPDDIKQKLLAWNPPSDWFVRLLRANDIDGSCPSWLIESVRAENWQCLDLMSPK